MALFRRFGLVIILGLIVLSVLSSPAGASAGDLKIEPEVVKISSFFSGVTMHITGDIPPGSQAVLRVRGKRIEEELMRKAHHWDVWMNSGEVDIIRAPRLYFVLSSDPGLIGPHDSDFPWEYDEVAKEATVSGKLNPSERNAIFKEFVELKERDHLYRLFPGGLKIDRDGDRWRAEADVRLPSRLIPGTYHVALWAVRDGKEIERHDALFEARREGLPEFLHSMAVGHGVVYGFLAVAIAMVVGMITGLAFHRKGGGH